MGDADGDGVPREPPVTMANLPSRERDMLIDVDVLLCSISETEVKCTGMKVGEFNLYLSFKETVTRVNGHREITSLVLRRHQG